MDIQEIIAFVILALAVAYLLRKYFEEKSSW
jgi:membrane protein implicated in regulation of membrane protease activity